MQLKIYTEYLNDIKNSNNNNNNDRYFRITKLKHNRKIISKSVEIAKVAVKHQLNGTKGKNTSKWRQFTSFYLSRIYIIQ